MNLKTKIIAGVILVLLLFASFFFHSWRKEVKARKIQDKNVEQLLNDKDQVLQLSRKEFEKAKTDWKLKLDSVTKAHDIALKSVKSAVITNVEYKDTGSVKIIYKTIEKVPNSALFTMPIAYSDSCWGFAGKIISKDPESKFDLTKRTFKNSTQLIVLRKRFLGFLWYQNKRNEYKNFSDCGETDFTSIEFVKK